MAFFSEYSWDSRDYLFAQVILSRHTNKLSMFEYLLVLQIFQWLASSSTLPIIFSFDIYFVQDIKKTLWRKNGNLLAMERRQDGNDVSEINSSLSEAYFMRKCRTRHRSNGKLDLTRPFWTSDFISARPSSSLKMVSLARYFQRQTASPNWLSLSLRESADWGSF